MKNLRPQKLIPTDTGPGEDVAWGMVSTLLAGPLVWGGIGMLIDSFVGTTRIFLPLGIVIGSLVSFYIVYVRFGRETETSLEEK
jgi:ATP synthase protein I